MQKLIAPLLCPGVLALFVTLVWSEPARGASGDWTIGVTPSYTYVVVEGHGRPKGGGGAMSLSYGLTDAIALGVSGLWSGQQIDESGNDKGGLFQVTNLALSVQYAFDQLRICPAIEGGVGLLYARYQGNSAMNVGLQLGVSVEYALRRWLLVGAAFHYHAFISDPAKYPVYFDAGPRVSVRWR